MKAQRPVLRKFPVSFFNWMLLTFLLLLPLMALDQVAKTLPGALMWGIVGTFIASLIAYNLVAYDKRQAVAQGQRVPEAILHALELCGGWPGSFLSQLSVRHKVNKLSYRLQFMGIIAIYQIVAALLIDGRVRIG